ncbi:hypothetical protein SCLCIDRAFT_27573 [Scleroderma citrinum Foug A]|uniref:Uncharacterized protein n=1 Tax=Scleroderma citrinum Foug A TaxID=1036808 RepID=A0A0C3A394_9AGAM|nr:hypothetical protein SCLCIDRAFT_27573 [Scleroderma citrinum Foug A]
MSLTWNPTAPRSPPLSPVQNLFLTPLPQPPLRILSVVPEREATPPAGVSSQPGKGIPARPDKGKGRQHATPTPSAPSSMDATPTSASASSVPLTPEQHVCLVRMLKCLDEWLAQGWQPEVDESHLRTLAEIFNAAESVVEGSLSNIRRADLAWRLADSEGWDKSARSSIMGAINIQVTVTKILFKDYGESLIASFRAFLERKETEMGSSRRPTGISGLPLSEEATLRNSAAKLPKRNGMKEADYLLTRRIPGFLHTMRLAEVLPSTSPLLVKRLTGRGTTFSSHYASPPPEGTHSVPQTPLMHSLMGPLPRSSPTTNFDTFLLAMDASPTPIPLEDFDVSGVIPSVTGQPTMTKVIDQFMEDLLTQEFSPVVPDEDIWAKGGG